jgi:phosphosulfolactate synthase (CoM biosynthesis protein A)
LTEKAGLKAKPEVGIQFGAGGATAEAELAAEGTRDPEWAILQAKRFVDAGAYMIMIESEGITENVTTWRTDVVAKIINAIDVDATTVSFAATVSRKVFPSASPALTCQRTSLSTTRSAI